MFYTQYFSFDMYIQDQYNLKTGRHKDVHNLLPRKYVKEDYFLKILFSLNKVTDTAMERNLLNLVAN